MACSNRNLSKCDVIRELVHDFGNDLQTHIIQEIAKQNNYDMQKSHHALTFKVKTIKKSSIPHSENYISTFAIDTAIDDIKKNFKVLLLMRGLPGSGKSYLGQNILRATVITHSSDHIFSADDFFKQSGRYVYDVTKIHEAHDWTQRNVFQKMLRGYSPLIVDNTNTEIWEMLPYARMAAQCGYKIHIIEANTKWCFNCNELTRRNQHGVPKNKIRAMIERYQRNITPELLLCNYNLTLDYQKNPQVRSYPPVSKIEERTNSNSMNTSSVHNNNSMNEDLKIPEFMNNFNLSCEIRKNDRETFKLVDVGSDDNDERNFNKSKNGFSPHNIDISSWGVDENCLKSWDIVAPIDASTNCEIQNFDMNSIKKLKIQPQTTDQECQTDLYDFYRQFNNVNNDDCKIISSQPRDINLNHWTSLFQYHKPGLLDKSVWTQEDVSSDRNEDLDRIRNIFPNIPQAYIEEIYEKCKENVDLTIEIFLEDNKDYSNLQEKNEPSILKQSEPINENLTENTQNTPSQQEIVHESSVIETGVAYDSDIEFDQVNGSDDNEFIELNLGHNLVEHLEQEFGDQEINHPKGFLPVVQVPKTFARQLYAFYIESVYQQMETQKSVLDNLIKEDEAFAKKLMEEENNMTGIPTEEGLREIMNEQAALNIYQKEVQQWKNIGPDDLATRMTKKKLIQSFPTIDSNVLLEIFNANDNNYEQTVDDLLVQVNPSDVHCVTNIKEPPMDQMIMEELKRDNELYGVAKDDDGAENRSSQSFRDEAGEYLKKRHDLYQKAQEYFSKGQMEVAQFYSELAKKQTQFYDIANSRAATILLEEHSRRLKNFDTLDLHFLFVKEAIPALDVFIDRNINLLKGSTTQNSQNLFVITGRGNRSKNGTSKIKPAVISRLKKRKIQFVQMNPGLLKIKVNKDTITTSDLQINSS